MYLQLLQRVPIFVLVFFRLAGMFIYAPLLGSTRIPRRLKVLLVSILALSVTPGIHQSVSLPPSSWELALAIGGEMMFGLAMGMVMSFTFIAAQWAGEIIGQQMGFNISEIFDPQFGGQGSIIGDMYFMLTLVTFLAVGGHRTMLRGVRASFDFLPLLSPGIDRPLLDMLTGLVDACTTLAFQLAAPMLITLLIVDLVLGLIGRTMPALNVMAAGMSVRSGLGLVVVILGIGMTTSVIGKHLLEAMERARLLWTVPLKGGAG